MDAMRRAEEVSFDGPAVYRIRVQGRIAPSWSDRLAGMNVSLDAPRAEPLSTTLLGELRDQASLAGVLRTLYELHRPVLLVECLLSEEGEADRSAP
jgi:hypothetical protein